MAEGARPGCPEQKLTGGLPELALDPAKAVALAEIVHTRLGQYHSEAERRLQRITQVKPGPPTSRVAVPILEVPRLPRIDR